MARLLGMGSKEAVREWMTSTRFTKPWNTLLNDYLNPLRDQAEANGEKVRQGPSLEAVQAAIEQGEGYGDQRYSGEEDEIPKTDYQEVDHYAYCLVQLKKRNKEHRDGIFHRQTMTATEVEARLWMAMQRARKDWAAAHRRQRKRKFTLTILIQAIANTSRRCPRQSGNK
jgi:hypothetical protein